MAVEDLYTSVSLPLATGKVPASGAPGFDVYRDSLRAYAFNDASTEEIYLSFTLPHDFKDGGDFHLDVHWSPGNNTDTGTVRWGIEWVAAVRNTTTGAGSDLLSANTTITYIEQAGTGTAYEHLVAEVADPGITITGAEPDMVIMARVFRDATHANDTYNADAVGILLDAHYQIDRYATPNKEPDFYT